MPRINATRFSSVMGLLLGGTVAGTELEAGVLSSVPPAPGTVMVAPPGALPWARARAEHAVRTSRIGKCFGNMGCFTCIVHLPLVGCKLRQRVRARQHQPLAGDMAWQHGPAGLADGRFNPALGVGLGQKNYAPAATGAADLSCFGSGLGRSPDQPLNERSSDARGVRLP